MSPLDRSKEGYSKCFGWRPSSVGTRLPICRRTCSAQMSVILNGGFWPTILPLFHVSRRTALPEMVPSSWGTLRMHLQPVSRSGFCTEQDRYFASEGLCQAQE